MNKNDISKIKRRLTADGRSPIEIRGVFVNSKKAIISELQRSVITMGQSEADMYLQLFKRVLSGDIGRNLSLLSFSAQQVMEGELHERLMRLAHSGLTDEEALQQFVSSVLEGTQLEGNHLLLIMSDAMDLDFKGASHDEGDIDENAPTAMFRYVICALCPVKAGKGTLVYDGGRNDFTEHEPDEIVCAPELGFMFPCFEDGGANISSALFYTKDIGENHSDFITGALSAAEQPNALERKETFKNVLMDALEDECSYDVIENVNEQLLTKLDAQKKDKHSEPAVIGGNELSEMLTDSGVSEEKKETFVKRFEEEFGYGAELPVSAITEDKQLEVKTGDVSVKVSPRQASLIETRVIDGIRYILIPADEGVTVNGISIGIKE